MAKIMTCINRVFIPMDENRWEWFERLLATLSSSERLELSGSLERAYRKIYDIILTDGVSYCNYQVAHADKQPGILFSSENCAPDVVAVFLQEYLWFYDMDDKITLYLTEKTIEHDTVIETSAGNYVITKNHIVRSTPTIRRRPVLFHHPV